MELIDPRVARRPPARAPPAELTKIGTNNRLRRFLRIALARFALSNPDAVGPAGRRQRDDALARRGDASSCCASAPRPKPTPRSSTRSRPAWRWPRSTARTRRRGSPRSRRCGDRLRPEVRNRLAALLEHLARRRASRKRTRRFGARRPRRCTSIDTSRSFYAGIETLFFGLSLGSVLVLVAIGLAITFGVMGVINMAHGELMMLGAYTTYVVQTADARRMLGVSILLAIPAAFLVAGAGGRAFSSARSSDFSTAGRSRRCWRRSASAWCCSSSSARSSRRTTARSRRPPG